MCQQKAGANKKAFHSCPSIKMPVRNQDETRNQLGYATDSNSQCAQVDYHPLKRVTLRDRRPIKIRDCKYVM